MTNREYKLAEKIIRSCADKNGDVPLRIAAPAMLIAAATMLSQIESAEDFEKGLEGAVNYLRSTAWQCRDEG